MTCMEDWQIAEQRRADARRLAPTLVGLDVHEAVVRAERQGLEARVLGDVMTTEFRPGRINLTVDSTGTVTEAT